MMPTDEKYPKKKITGNMTEKPNTYATKQQIIFIEGNNFLRNIQEKAHPLPNTIRQTERSSPAICSASITEKPGEMPITSEPGAD